MERFEAGCATLYAEFEPDVLLNPTVDELLDPTTVSSSFNWHPQSSGITVPQNIAQRLEQAWYRHILDLDIDPTEIGVDGEMKACRQAFSEGKKRLSTRYRYERDPHARRECIQYYGTRCQVCGKDMGEVYPGIGEGYVHVHHLRPVAEHDEEYTVDPIRDLRPVCPNCHSMLHRCSPPVTIAELRRIMGVDS